MPAYDASIERIQIDFTTDNPPQDLLELLASWDRSYNDYQHKWISGSRIILFRQRLVDTESGGEGPFAIATELIRVKGQDGNPAWSDGEAASMYPCDAIRD